MAGTDSQNIDQATLLDQQVSQAPIEQAAQPVEEQAVQASTGPAPGDLTYSGQAHENPFFRTNDTEPVAQSASTGTEDWFLTRLNEPHISTKELFDVYGVDGFKGFKDKEEYWKDPKIREMFVNEYGSQAKNYFDDAYDDSKKEFSAFQMGVYQRAQTGYELIRDDVTALRSNLVMRFSNIAGTVKQGRDWSDPTKDYREAPTEIKFKTKDDSGKEVYVTKEYSPELLKELEKDPSFGGLAYSDAFYSIDPNEGVNGLYFNSVYDGQVLDEATGKKIDVRNDQVVSRWDLETGPTSVMGVFQVDLGTVLKNNKLEADSVLDYAKILVKTPLNTAVNVLDTGVQLARAAIAGGYGITNMFKDKDIDVRESEVYKYLTTKGVKLKSNTTSMTREALQDGFFGSLEASLTTIADVGVQVALAGALGRAGSGAASIIKGGLEGEALLQAQSRAAEITVRSTLTALATKDAYNEAIENGYSTAEASVITGAMTMAMWKATKYASYIFGDYEAKVLRSNIKASVSEEIRGMLKTMFNSVDDATIAAGTVGEERARYAIIRMQKAVAKVFGNITKSLPKSKLVYVAREEAFEEMTEELFQDGVKQAASAYGKLINNAHAAGKGRYLSIFDDGYFPDALERYAASGIAGGVGGPLGMIGNHVQLDPISSSSSITDILLAGKKSDLISVLDEMKNNGSLGPKQLSTDYDEALSTFDPLLEGDSRESLSDMVYNLYRRDIEVVDTFINKGMFGTARLRLENDDALRDSVSRNGMRNDYVKLMGNLLDYHNKTGISMSIYPELDGYSENRLVEALPNVLLAGKEKYAAMKADIEAVKEEAKELIAAKGKPVKEDAKPQVEEKDEAKEKNKANSESENVVSRVQKEALLANVKDADIVSMLSNYRKVRAISNGSASEYYLIQNELAGNTMLGSKAVRLSKYADLGDEPFKDMLLAMRIRSLEDEKIHAQTSLAANELEATILGIKEVDDETIKILDKAMKEKSSLFTEKGFRSIISLFEKADFKEAEEAFDPNSKFSMFKKDADGKVIEADMMEVYKELLSLESDNDSINFYEHIGYGGGIELDAYEYFTKLSKDIKKSYLPAYIDEGILSFYESSNPLIGAILERGSERLVNAVKTSGENNIKLMRLAERAKASLDAGLEYVEEPFKRKNIQSLFKRAVRGGLSKNTLVADGLSVVTEMLDSSYEGIYTMSDTTEIDDVLAQIEIRQEIAKELSKFVTPADSFESRYYRNMLAGFRKSIIDLIDIKYKPGSAKDTSIEEHAYKDYSTTSDFFVDFLYDPIHLNDIYEKDPVNYSAADQKVLEEVKMSASLLSPSFVEVNPETGVMDPITPEFIKVTTKDIDEDLLKAYLDNIYKDNIKKAVRIFDSPVIALPLHIFGISDPTVADVNAPFVLQGAMELAVAKWLFTKARDIINVVADKATVTPYIEAKNKDIRAVFRIYGSLLNHEDMHDLKEMVMKAVPELEALLTKDESKTSAIEYGKANIRMEKALHDIYNNVDGLLDDASLAELQENVDYYIEQVSNEFSDTYTSTKELGGDVTASLRELSVLIGSFTTDFTPYYAKFKAYIEGMSPSSNILVAAQEHAAKYAGAYIYSNKFRLLADKLAVSRLVYNPFTDNISAVYVTGKAGSGKSSAVIKTGLKFATEILEQQGYTNTTVLPVSNFDNQIEIVAKSVGDLSKGEPGMSADALLELLQSAVTDQDEAAIAHLKKVGVIVMDEVTYVQADDLSNNPTSTLESINGLIKQFNASHNFGGHEISLLLLGDPKQSGVYAIDENSIIPTSMRLDRAHPLAYMDLSFRSRNNYLVDSLSVITETVAKSSGDAGAMPEFVKLEAGTRYGSTAGKMYGLQVIDAPDKGSTNTLQEVLNDAELAKNIINNIDKVKTENLSLKEGEEPHQFTVLIAVEDVHTFNSIPSKIGDISRMDEYKDHFRIVKASEAGGSEANYVIAEIAPPEQEAKSVIRIKILGERINTLATRAIDFGILINRDVDFKIPELNRSVKEVDGDVILPDAVLNGAAKEVLKKNYLELLSDIEADTSATLPDQNEAAEVGPEVQLPEEEAFILSEKVAAYLAPDNGLLNISYAMTVFPYLEGNDLLNLIEYYGHMQALNSSDEVDNSVLISTMDGVLSQLQPVLDVKDYESLFALQGIVIEDRLIGTNKDILDTHISSVINYLDTLVPTEEEAEEDVEEDDAAKKWEAARASAALRKTIISTVFTVLDDETLNGTHEAMFKAALYPALNDDYEVHLAAFIESNFAEQSATIVADTKLYGLINSMVKSKAARAATPKAEPLPEINTLVTSKLLLDYAISIEDYDIPMLNKLSSKLHPDAGQTRISIPEYIYDLFTIYNSESVKKELKRIVDDRLEFKLQEENNKALYNSTLQEMERLKMNIGIPATTTARIDLYNAIRGAYNSLAKKVSAGGEDVERETEPLFNDIVKAMDLWNALYKGSHGTFGDPKYKYGKGFITRNLGRKETLDDYTSREDKSGTIYTIGVSSYITKNIGLEANPNLGVSNFIYANMKQSLALFNFDKAKTAVDKRIPPKKGGIRVVRYLDEKKEVKYQYLVYVTTPNSSINSAIKGSNLPPNGFTNVIISQLDSRVDAKGNSATQLNTKLSSTMEKLYEEKSSFVVGNGWYKFMDVPVNSDISDFLYTRAGGTIHTENVDAEIKSGYPALINPTNVGGSWTPLTYNDLKAGVGISESIYINMHKPLSGESGYDEGNLRGEGGALYSASQSAELDSTTIENTIKEGKGLDAANKLKVTGGGITSEVGMMRFTLKVPLDKLGEVMKANQDIYMGAYVSNFSIAMQQDLVTKTRALKKGQNISFSRVDADGVEIPGSFTKFTYTQDAADFFDMMSRDLEVYYKLKGEDYKSMIQGVVAKLNDPTVKGTLNMFSMAYIYDRTRIEGNENAKQTSLLYRDVSGGYVFNINKYLRALDSTTLAALNTLTDLANYNLKPGVVKGKTDFYGKMQPDIVKHLGDYLISPVIGIKAPIFRISVPGVAAINTAIAELTKPKVVEEVKLSANQLALVRQLLSYNDPEELLHVLNTKSISSLNALLSDYSVILEASKTSQENVKLMPLLEAGISHINTLLRFSEAMKSQESINYYLSEYAQQTPSDSEFRTLLGNIVLDFVGPEEERQAALDVLKDLGQDAEYLGVTETLIEYLEPGEMTAYLENICKLKK